MIRRFSSDDRPPIINDQELNIPTYWIRPPRTVAGSPGMHRFVWDLHYPPPPSISREFPISAIYGDTPQYPLGPTVLPATYSVKLTVNGASSVQPLEIRMDPRVRLSAEQLHAQFELSAKIAAAMEQSFTALRQVIGLREQLRLSAGEARQGELADAISKLDQQADLLAGSAEGSTFLSSIEGRSLSRLNVALTTLMEVVESADAAPTSSQNAAFVQVQDALNQQIQHWKRMKTEDVFFLNRKLKQAGLKEIDPEMATFLAPGWQKVEKVSGED